MRQRQIISEEKQRLLAEHAAILQQHHPKANSQYMGGFNRWGQKFKDIKLFYSYTIMS